MEEGGDNEDMKERASEAPAGIADKEDQRRRKCHLDRQGSMCKAQNIACCYKNITREAC